MERILQAFAHDLKERGGLDVRACFIDGHSWRQKGSPGVGKTKRDQGSKIMAMGDRAGFPLSVCVTSASRHEVTLVAATLVACFAPDLPEKLMGDGANDNDPLGDQLAERGSR